MRFIAWCFAVIFTFGILGVLGAGAVLSYYSRDLPEYSQLSVYEPPNTTRLYASNGKLMKEYATEHRVFVPISAIPDRVKQAFLAAEDRKFYQHEGVDFQGIARAIYTNIKNKGASVSGASTITQQVVKNFLLGNEKSYERKIKEAILAFRISKAYSKDKILELYLNQIYLGKGSYGVAAAALDYFNKSVDELTIEEAALLASMPKSPGTFDPEKFYDRVKLRRDWVIDGMLEEGYIQQSEASEAKLNPIILRKRSSDETVVSDTFAEEVRRWLQAKYGVDKLYKGGLTVRTTLDSRIQMAAERALVYGLTAYDMTKGWRGPVKKLEKGDNWMKELKNMDKADIPSFWSYALVKSSDAKAADVVLDSGEKGVVKSEDMAWAGSKAVNQTLKSGYIIIVQKNESDSEDNKSEEKKEAKNSYQLRQIPIVSGAMVAMDPNTGRVLAMANGISFGHSEYNRVTQARRQPGSAFKPFVYLSALENGYNPNSIIVDGPITLSQGVGLPAWTPQNYTDDFLGPQPLRAGVEKSRNAMTVRLAVALGIDKIVDVGKRFGIYDNPPRNFSMVLGALETTPIRLATAYSIVANGGLKVEPRIIDRIQDRFGKTIYKWDDRTCETCTAGVAGIVSSEPPVIEDNRQRVLDEQVSYQMTNILTGVIKFGTATKAKILGRPIAGKTGTTNDSNDTWFVGYTPDMVVATYIGYDRPKTLGKKATGGSVALPAFIKFMQIAMKDVPPKLFPVPSSIRLVRTDHRTSQPATADTPPEQIILEAFRTKLLPSEARKAEEASEDEIQNRASSVDTVPTDNDFKVKAEEKNYEGESYKAAVPASDKSSKEKELHQPQGENTGVDGIY